MNKEMINSFVNYFGAAFSFMGALLTFYFAIYYIPEYARSVEKEKQTAANAELIFAVEEIAFNKRSITPDAIRSLIHAKEIRHGIVYPWTPDELIIQAQENFASNRFLSYESRAEVSSRLDSIRYALKAEPPVTISQKSSGIDILSLLASILTALLGLLGTIAGYQSIKKVRERAVEQEVETKVQYLESEIMTARDYETLIGRVLSELKVPHEVASARKAMRVDFMVNLENKTYLIEAKYYFNRLVGIDVVAKLSSVAAFENTPMILVTNSKLTNIAKDFVNDFNSNSPKNPLTVVVARTEEDLKREFTKLFATAANSSSNDAPSIVNR